MSIIAIARRNWALRLSVVLNVCVLLYVCAHIGSSGPWIEEPPTNWAAAPETYDLSNGTQKGVVASLLSSSSSAAIAVKDAAPANSNNNNNGGRTLRLVTTTPPPNGAKAETLDKSQEHPRNQTVLSCPAPLRLSLRSSCNVTPDRCFRLVVLSYQNDDPPFLQ